MNNTRQLVLNSKLPVGGKSVVYLMSRDQRLNDNHALLAAQKSATESQLPLVIVFILYPSSGVRAFEHFKFMLDGLEELEASASELNIGFIIKNGEPLPTALKALKNLQPKELFLDFSPLKGPRKFQKDLAKTLDYKVTVVDTHNIIPLWVTSDKEEFAAHTIRSKVHKNLESWLIEPKQLIKHPYGKSVNNNDWPKLYKSIEAIKKNGSTITFESGEKAASKALGDFIKNRLPNYALERNVPTINGQSNLSPYLHFGQLSSLRISLEIIKTLDEPPLLFKAGKLASYEGDPTYADSVNAYLEELIVRKELADNYCFYNPNYNNFDGAKPWAKDSLLLHSKDLREFIYSLEQLKQAQTHDEAWNAAQKEMIQTGKMHGYMRMYWAKKILEWTESPSQAIEYAVYLNDHYSIDGGDPNGYTGTMWSIAGIHDRPWFERSVFGKIRYMNRGGLERRFNVQEYIDMWS